MSFNSPAARAAFFAALKQKADGTEIGSPIVKMSMKQSRMQSPIQHLSDLGASMGIKSSEASKGFPKLNKYMKGK